AVIAGQYRTGALTAEQFHAQPGMGGGPFRQDGGGKGAVLQQGLHGVAGGGTGGNGVAGIVDGLGLIGVLVDINVADTIQVLDNRYPGVAADAFDQAFAAARYNDINVFGHGNQRTHGSAVGGFHDLYSGGRQTGAFQAAADALG